jgi:squalene-hopene/tetraprenyl-beta-curcumene cyclase
MISQQNPDGGFGGAKGLPSTIEETALAVEALARFPAGGVPAVARAVEWGCRWLADRTRQGTRFDPSPIGFYFAKLWYWERLYPILFTVAALERGLPAIPKAEPPPHEHDEDE